MPENEKYAPIASARRANCGPFLATGNSADSGSNSGAACDNSGITLLLRVRGGRECVGRDGDHSVSLDNIGERETDAGPAFHSA